MTQQEPEGTRKHLHLDSRAGSIQVQVQRDARHANGKKDAGEETWNFKFDQVLDTNCSQQNVFETCMSDIVTGALTGVNGTLLAYGQTGAGKTHTITGKPREAAERGLCFRTVKHMFNEIDSSDSNFIVRMSYLEIYKEQLFDLLCGDVKKVVPSVFYDEHGTTVLKDLSRRIVRSEEEAMSCIFEGETNRVIASHEMNYSSTRSHCILTFYIEARHKKYDESVGLLTEQLTSSKINIVDLAGSERVLKTNSTGVILEEAKSINKSLSFLEQVVVALADKKRDHIPYRQSHLTQYLRDSLGGNCRTLMIACIWPQSTHLEQTLATLKFATRMMRIKNSPARNDKSSVCDALIVQEYKREIGILRAEIAHRDSISKFIEPTGDFVDIHTPYSQQQLLTLNRNVDEFLKTGDSSFVKPQSIRHVIAIQNLLRGRVNQPPPPVQMNTHPSSPVQMKTHPNLPVESKPLTTRPQVKPFTNSSDSETADIGIAEPHVKLVVDREEKFVEFKLSDMGRQCTDNVTAVKGDLLGLYTKSKAMKATVNEIKVQLDDLISNDSTRVQEIKHLKREYKNAIEKLKEIKSETMYSNQMLTSCRNKISETFETWIQQNYSFC